MTKRNSIQYYLDLLTVLTQKEMKVRYKSSFLGYIWSIAQPLALAFVFFIAFKVVMRIPMENYTLFLISGLFPWQWFANSTGYSSTVFLTNASIIKKVIFPRNTLPAAIVLQDSIHYLISVPVIILFMFLYDKAPSYSWLYGIPILLFIQFLMLYGVALIVSSVNLFFRDLERLINVFLTLLFYCTPILYPEDMIPDNYRYLINLNPIAPLMIAWRNLFLDGILGTETILVSLAYSLVALITGLYIYNKLSWKFAEVL